MGYGRYTTVNGGLFTARGGSLAGTTTLNNGATLTLSGKMVNNGTLTIHEGDALLQGGALTGNGRVEKSGSGTLTVSNTTLTQKTVNLNEGTLTLNDSTVTTDVIALRGTALKLTGSTVLNGAIDPTNVTLTSGATWNIPDNATVQSVVDDLSHAGQIHFTSARTGKFVPTTLQVKNLNGQNGTISLRVRPDIAQNNADRLVIDGGRATGKTILNLVNAGNSGTGLATTGKGIQVVEAINGATTEEGAFVHGSAQHVRAGFRLGSHNDMTFGEGTSSRAPLRDSAKHSVRELPVNWWVQPSVIRTFSSRGDMRVGTSTAGSGMTFSPSQNGTSLDLQAGLEARVRENITLGVQAGYAHSINGSSAEGYSSQATLNVTF